MDAVLVFLFVQALQTCLILTVLLCFCRHDGWWLHVGGTG